MRTKKGGIAEKMGIKYRPNLVTMLLGNFLGRGPNACFDEVARNWSKMSNKEPLKFEPIDKDCLLRIDLITGNELKKGEVSELEIIAKIEGALQNLKK